MTDADANGISRLKELTGRMNLQYQYLEEAGCEEYFDMLELLRPVSASHPPMPLADRAAQFSPFAALTGHDAAIQETARLTRQRIELDEDRKEVLDERLQMIRENLAGKPEITFICFKPDGRKEGGSYPVVTGRVKKLDITAGRILLEDGTSLEMENLISIEGDLFGKMEP